MAQQNIHVFRNTDWNATVNITLNGAPLNITGYHFRFTAKFNIHDPDNKALFIITDQAVTTGCFIGIIITNTSGGIITIHIPSQVYTGTACSNFTPPVCPVGHRIYLVYDLQMFDTSSDKYEIMNGSLIVDPEVTQIDTAAG